MRRVSVKCKITEVFKVELKPFDTVPIQLIAELRARLSNIRTMLRSVPAGSRVWRTLAAGPMLLDIEGWRFQYRVDVNHRRLIVEEALYLGK